MQVLTISFVILIILAFLFRSVKKRSGVEVTKTFPHKWRVFLQQNIVFYNNLNDTDRQQFESDILRFLATVRITGVQTIVNEEDRLYVACSAVIPVFAFKEWEYSSLTEVLLYPDLFDKNFNIEGEKRNISGMVGTGGAMNNIVIFSKPALRQGFDVNSDKKNVGIHEFVHLFDKQDGSIDGIPNVMMDNQAVLPWLDLIRKKTKVMLDGKSDINLYGATNNQEFLAVASEYFFERPKLLQKKHPELYDILSSVFKQDLAHSFNSNKQVKHTIGRNDSCPCGSGKKFKWCCLRNS